MNLLINFNNKMSTFKLKICYISEKLKSKVFLTKKFTKTYITFLIFLVFFHKFNTIKSLISDDFKTVYNIYLSLIRLFIYKLNIEIKQQALKHSLLKTFHVSLNIFINLTIYIILYKITILLH